MYYVSRDIRGNTSASSPEDLSASARTHSHGQLNLESISFGAFLDLREFQVSRFLSHNFRFTVVCIINIDIYMYGHSPVSIIKSMLPDRTSFHFYKHP